MSIQITNDQLKIGVLVRTCVKELIEKDNISVDLVNWLSNSKYCKNTFDINFPFLKEVENDRSLSEQCKINGYDRYWKDQYNINGKSYLLCNDWYERNRKKFERWFSNIV